MAAGETARVEAFSDGVFAIAITLLVLDMKVPRALDDGRTLAAALMAMWPTCLAFVTSFSTILIMWINHHRMFTLIGRADDRCDRFIKKGDTRAPHSCVRSRNRSGRVVAYRL